MITIKESIYFFVACFIFIITTSYTKKETFYENVNYSILVTKIQANIEETKQIQDETKIIISDPKRLKQIKKKLKK